MKAMFRALVVYAACLTVFTQASDVVDLTSSEIPKGDGKVNFNQFLEEEKDGTLIEFYAPWCGHCKALAPKWEKAATELKNTPERPLRIAKVDATREKELAREYGVRGYPTIFLFKDGQKWRYTGKRDVEGIVAFVRKAAFYSEEDKARDDKKREEMKKQKAEEEAAAAEAADAEEEDAEAEGKEAEPV